MREYLGAEVKKLYFIILLYIYKTVYPKEAFCSYLKHMDSAMTLFLNYRHKIGAMPCTPELLFAIDMMSFVTKQFSLPYSPFPTICCFGNIPESSFKGNIRKLIGLLVDEYIESTFNRFLEMNFDKNPSYEFISEWTALYTRHVKVSGYRNFEFLIQCTLICLMTSIAYCFGVNMAPNNGIMEICELVSFFKKTSEWPLFAWEELQDTAERNLNVRKEIKKNEEDMLPDLDTSTEAEYAGGYSKIENRYINQNVGAESNYPDFESEIKTLNLSSENEKKYFQMDTKGVTNQLNQNSTSAVKHFNLDSLMETKQYKLDSTIEVSQFDQDSSGKAKRCDLDSTVEIKQFDQYFKAEAEQFEQDFNDGTDHFDLHCKAEAEQLDLDCKDEQFNVDCTNNNKHFNLDCLNEKKEFDLYCPAEDKNCQDETGHFDRYSKSEIKFDLNSIYEAKYSDKCFKPYSKYLDFDFKIDINHWKSVSKIEVKHFDLDSSIKSNYSFIDSKVEETLSTAHKSKFNTVKRSFMKTLGETEADGNRLGLAWIV